jgi:hypothetical protein
MNGELTKGGKRYFMTFIDDCTRFYYVYLLKSKDEALNYFKIYKAEVENQLEKKIRERLVRVQRMPKRAATLAPQLRMAFGWLPHLWHATTLPCSSSAFYVPKRAGSAAVIFCAACLACQGLWRGISWS